MKKFLAVALLLLPTAVAYAQPKEPAKPPEPLPTIRFPVAPPMPIEPAPLAPSRLGADALFVIDSDLPLILLQSPKGLVSVTQDSGPLRIRGTFVGGTKTESRTFKGKYLFVIEAVKSGNLDLFVIPVGVTDASKIIRKTLQVDAQNPIPPPDPKPTPDPPKPAPIPLAGFRVLIVYDAAKVTPEQDNILVGKRVRDYLQAKCVVGNDGKTKDFWILQAGLDVSAAPKWIGDVMQRHPGQTNYMIVSDGKTGYDGVLPANADEAISILQKIGGQ